MSNIPKVTVVTPSYNQGRFIEETIQSVLKQTYPNVEYIIVDGDSTDETHSILKKYESAIEKIIIEPDEGQSDAINKGFRVASGELIGWLNSDDMLLPHAIELTVVRYRRYPMASLFYGDLEIVDQTGRRIGNSKRQKHLTLSKLLNDRIGLVQPGSFYPASMVKKVGGLCKEFYLLMDLDLWLCLLKHGDGFHVGGKVAQFRRHSGAKSSEPLDKYFSESLVIHRKHGARFFSLKTYMLCRMYLRFLANKWHHARVGKSGRDCHTEHVQH